MKCLFIQTPPDRQTTYTIFPKVIQKVDIIGIPFLIERFNVLSIIQIENICVRIGIKPIR